MDISAPVPPLEEQVRIVARLDRELERLDAVISAKARLLALLRERRRQTIRRAVFRGIDTGLSMGSGSSSFGGEAPARWRRTRLKYLFESLKNGVWGSEPTGDNDDVICIRVADFNRSRHLVETENLTVRSVPPADRFANLLRYGDILLEISGGGEQQPVGDVVLFDQDFDAVCSNFIARLRPASAESSRFVWYLLTAFYEARANVPYIKQTTGIQNLDASAFFAQPCDVPDRDEQTRISTYLDLETDKIDRLHATVERQLVVLEERRDTLIFNAVTGRLGE